MFSAYTTTLPIGIILLTTENTYKLSQFERIINNRYNQEHSQFQKQLCSNSSLLEKK